MKNENEIAASRSITALCIVTYEFDFNDIGMGIDGILQQLLKNTENACNSLCAAEQPHRIGG